MLAGDSSYDLVMNVHKELQTSYQALLTLKATTSLSEEGTLAFMFVEW
jgi:hypothetical protein